jgi:hypothetical protein
MANSSLCDPILVANDTSIEIPQRIGFDGKDIDERWIQDIIQKQPNVLPASYFDVRYNKLLSVGYEVKLDDGFVDNLLVTPNGDLVIVETKLWRNPEARRQVVAQITDYAKSLMNWSFSDFDQAAKEYSNLFLQRELGIIDLVKCSIPDVDEKEFYDKLERNLSLGKILLLVVGDGIRENVEGLVEFFQKFTNIQFTLGLIELKVYQLNATQRLVIPDILFKTKEIQRAIVNVHESLRGKVDVIVDNSLEIKSQTKKSETLTPEEYFQLLKENAGEEAVTFAKEVQNDFVNREYLIGWTTKAFTIRVCDKENNKNATMAYFEYSGELLYSSGGLLSKERDLEYGNAIAILFPGTDAVTGTWHFFELANKDNYKKFVEIIDKYSQMFLNNMQNKN